MRTPQAAPANPGLNGTVTLFDSGVPKDPIPDPSRNQRVKVALFADQIVTIKHFWVPAGQTTEREVSSTASVANTFKEVDASLHSGRNILKAITTTAPTVWAVGVQLLDQSS